MSLNFIYAATEHPEFLGRCMAALWQKAQAIVKTDKTDSENRLWALKVPRGDARITPRNVVVQIVTGTKIAGLPNPVDASDADILQQLDAVLPELIEIG